ncbi:hypothetical protein AJ80_01650 [Polytolypa hystricis UAMH7299]|uniref:AB hydrolase-1 domain-containing protein n=1 Tax=Polytolypa hystricis (strain UAMH7299) TaxID=1447883 RepID=A0A2B7YRQ7_POLH7|nr:hypothetical protein AJ80_01650 [Polytolypa hystricis UAMH7299]
MLTSFYRYLLGGLVLSISIQDRFPFSLIFHSTSEEALHRRNYFYVGGRYVNVTQENDFESGVVKVEQMYVEQLTPGTIRQKYPLVLWPGAGQTGTNFLNTPGGRGGWASHWLKRGYTVYIIDSPERGRSPWLATDGGIIGSPPLQLIQQFFTTAQDFKLWPQAYLHTQWPGTGYPGSPAFDQFYASQVQLQLNLTRSEAISRAGGIALLDKIGPAFLLMPGRIWLKELSRLNLKARRRSPCPPFVNEFLPAPGPARPYGITNLPLTYDPPVGNPHDIPTVTRPPPKENLSSCILQAEPAKKLVNLVKIPVLLVTAEASYHAISDYCTVDYLKQAGVETKWLNLSDYGIHGNGHMLFMEKNNIEIVQLLDKWLESKARG